MKSSNCTERRSACIVQGHPFVDGNKRAGLLSANVVLRMNDLAVVADEDASADLVLAVASGLKGKAEVADFLRRATVPPLKE